MVVIVFLFIIILFLSFETTKLHETTQKALGKSRELGAEGESMNICSEF